uniref:F-box domain-containing protein n=1 Tax=Arundo donax TaxID=35708 RepID=A0A0A9EME5_ARUDO
MASLASAALACKRWRRVASDPAIFRLFHALRRPSLVGFILTDRGDKPVPLHFPALRFVCATRNPNLASAAADGDFFFEDHPNIDSDDEWRLRGCDGGRLLLSRGRYGTDLAVYDPIPRTAVFFRPPPAFEVIHYAIVASFQVIARLLWSRCCRRLLLPHTQMGQVGLR